MASCLRARHSGICENPKTPQQENIHGQVYRDGCSCVKLHTRSGDAKRVGSQVVQTNVRCLIETVRQIPRAAPQLPG